MPLFKINTYGKAKEVKPVDFPREAYLQTFVENNLRAIFDLTFVASRRFIEGIQPDTIAFDENDKAFVIIEYKLTDQASAIDQGARYYSLLRRREADFIILLPESLRKKYGRKDIRSENSRVVFIKKSYTAAQLSALEFNYPFEFWRYTHYGEMILFEQIEPPRVQVTPPIRGRSASSRTRELKSYTVDELLAKIKTSSAREAFESLRAYIRNTDSRVIETPKKLYVAYSVGRQFAQLIPWSKRVQLGLNLKSIDLVSDGIPLPTQHAIKDLGGHIRDLTRKGHWGSGNIVVNIENKEHAILAVPLIHYSLQMNSR